MKKLLKILKSLAKFPIKIKLNNIFREKFNIDEIKRKNRRTIFIDYETKIEVSEKYCNCPLDNIVE